ncbi:glycoside hydrolase family 5 protein [Cucurbitaria berberidis CBS 394.84]|uniref:Glycoside hydrolase family 5 protein n=1 Tax=Cucurbitaria berberidis CBS 394.84 TaxID=1168544 RepID=A0A9P4L8E5_9PLEO|nr:glycoside hydrolase family 5 protein [Cucurbitaria berberidis CBS 394.84]KAF1845257.1 glycoside hydrolase family 5 protein [Cucurbitaria berberidis CBS 394.84]
MYCNIFALGFLLSSFAFAAPSSSSISKRTASGLPLSTKGRDIIDANGEVFHFMSTNWPGHQEIMIPEGLQHSSIKDIVAWFPKFGLNSVRLTFAIEMIDDIYSNNPNQTLEKSVINALGQTNGTRVLGQILKKNPQFNKNTTRLQVWDAVGRELSKQGVIIHLDNHVSKAFWCCGDDDGNGWFGEKYFDVEKWKRGLAFFTKHAKNNWPTFSSVGLRNELRGAKVSEPVDWYTWYVHMTSAADAVHKAAPDALLFFSGLSYDTYIDPIPLGKALNGTSGTPTAGKTARFVPSNFSWENKIVLEIHKYDFEATQDNCTTFKSKWYQKGFQAVNPNDPATQYTFPMVISEWGFIQNGTYWNQTTYASCLIEMVKEYQVSWQHWELSGSFYLQTRPNRTPETIQGLEEAWGLLNYNWNGIRSPITLDNSLYKMIDALK